MTLLKRGSAALLLALSGLLWSVGTAQAEHCDPIDVPAVGEDRSYCHTPKPTATPKPTPAPTVAPTPAPTAAPPAGPVTTRRPVTQANTPVPTQDVEVPAGDTGPLGTPQILVDVQDDDQALETENTASASSWIFGFIVGLIVGALVGRASWGLRRKRRQQIFG